MATLTFTGLRQGAVCDLFFAAQVEPYRQMAARPKFAPIASVTVLADGRASFAGRPSRVEHSLFVDGVYARAQMDSTTRTT